MTPSNWVYMASLAVIVLVFLSYCRGVRRCSAGKKRRRRVEVPAACRSAAGRRSASYATEPSVDW